MRVTLLLFVTIVVALTGTPATTYGTIDPCDNFDEWEWCQETASSLPLSGPLALGQSASPSTDGVTTPPKPDLRTLLCKYTGVYSNRFVSQVPIHLTLKTANGERMSGKGTAYVSRPPGSPPANHHNRDIDIVWKFDGAFLTFSVGPFEYVLNITPAGFSGKASGVSVGGAPLSSDIELQKVSC